MSEQGHPAADELVQIEDHTGVLLLRLSEPPANALTARLRQALAKTLTAIAQDQSVGALVLIGRDDVFLRGLEYAELGHPQANPTLAELCAQIEAMPMPVICALSGAVQSAGLELALACSCRIATEGAVLSFPDSRLGLCPTGGTTQRLPRLIGAPGAIDILCDGKSVAAADALKSGLVDQVVSRGLAARALSLAHDLRQRHPRDGNHRAQGLIAARDRRDGLGDPAGFFMATEAARARFRDLRLAHALTVLEAIEAAQLLEFDQGLGYEEMRSADLARSAATRARLYGFACERAVLAPPRLLSGQKLGRITQMRVHGTKPALIRPLRLALAAGLRVGLDDENTSGSSALRQGVEEMIRHEVASAGLAPAAADADLARLVRGHGPAEVILSDGSNSEVGTIPVVLLGGTRAALPDEVVIWPGAKAGQVVEISAGPDASLALQATAYSMARSMGFQVHLQGPGLPLSQRLRQCLAQVFADLTARGHSAQTVAQSLGAMGIGIGADMALPELPPAGTEIQRVALMALANEGARCLEDGVARLPRDVDAAALFHGLLPAWGGGPMYQADQVGVMAMRQRLLAAAASAPALLTPAGLWDRLLAQGQSFADLNRDGLSRVQAP